MKTYYFSSKSFPVYSLMGVIALLLASCGSYKNSYDNDGVYGSGANNRQDDKTTASDNHYKNYFDSLHDDSQVFTDVDQYSTTAVDSTQADNKAYANDNGGWGSNSNTTVIVYDNGWGDGYYNPWYYGSSWGFGYYGGWGWGLGWGYSPWYGYSNWGYGGYGYPYYGGYYGGYHNHYYNNYYGGRGRNVYAYNAGRGRTSYSNSNGLGRSSGRSAYVPGRRSTSTSYSTRGDYRNGNSISRNNGTFNGTRNQGTRSNNTYTPTRNNNSYSVPSRSNNSAPTRSYSPSPSYTPSSSGGGGGRSGGGNSGGGGGGGRSGGGGGRRG